ncbi:MAG: hypothetical protein N2595_10665 [bacterium]|nr:hypothetical protein [bacterium]
MNERPAWLNDALHAELVDDLVSQYCETERARAAAGITQLVAAWRDADGDATALRSFVRTRFVPSGPRLAQLLAHSEDAIYHLRGHLAEIHRALNRWRDQADIDDPGIDDLLAQFDPAPDLDEELYRSKLAFVILLNFPRRSFAEKQRYAPTWSADEWAAVRLADAVPHRVPRALRDRARIAFHHAREFYHNFHIPVGCVVADDGSRPFPPQRTLLAHWLVREEIRASYGMPQATARQRLLARIMGRHVDGSIPLRVLQGTATSWCPFSNAVNGEDPGPLVGPQRYAVWCELFQLARATDPYFPDFPTHIARALTMDNQLSVETVEALLRDLLEAPVRRNLAELASARLGRPLQAFDIYYNNLAPVEPLDELDAAVAQRFPDAASFQQQLPQILRALGFKKNTANFLTAHIRVEIARGSGHASPARLLEYPSILRTSHQQQRLNWPAFVTAMHELGHCVEQVFSLHLVPRPALIGVPNLGVTEGFAFTFQAFARHVLDLPAPPLAEAVTTVNSFLTACEIAGAGLLDLLMWRWLYAHPDASPEALRDATLACADELWKRYYAPYFGHDENHLLAAYQHMIGMMLYLPNYTVGHLIAHLIRRHLTPHSLAREIQRMCALGNLTPDAWLSRALGASLSAQPFIHDTQHALTSLISNPTC